MRELTGVGFVPRWQRPRGHGSGMALAGSGGGAAHARASPGYPRPGGSRARVKAGGSRCGATAACGGERVNTRGSRRGPRRHACGGREECVRRQLRAAQVHRRRTWEQRSGVRRGCQRWHGEDAALRGLDALW
uniref:Uncharacterized protein n=1 Tax=Setaria viridis TaxID=4556 RepID=A0A4U6VNL3_SETVI|nr:hypothetical protein SEVIR_2G054900v2 [Setaria viridis]